MQRLPDIPDHEIYRWRPHDDGRLTLDVWNREGDVFGTSAIQSVTLVTRTSNGEVLVTSDRVVASLASWQMICSTAVGALMAWSDAQVTTIGIKPGAAAEVGRDRDEITDDMWASRLRNWESVACSVDGESVDWRVLRGQDVASAVALIGDTAVAVTALGLASCAAAEWVPDRVERVSPSEVAALHAPG
jgi:hypothetical protein